MKHVRFYKIYPDIPAFQLRRKGSNGMTAATTARKGTVLKRPTSISIVISDDGPVSQSDPSNLAMDSVRSASKATTPGAFSGSSFAKSLKSAAASMANQQQHGTLNGNPSANQTTPGSMSGGPVQNDTGMVNGKDNASLAIQLLTCVKGITDINEVLGKVTELVKHLTRLQEYHRNDGMKLQKTLGDFYWEYSQWRVEIADRMSDDGYASASMKMLKTLNTMGIFKNDDIWYPTYYAYNTLWNFSDSSTVLAKALAEADAVRLLTLNIGHKPYIDNVMQSKNVYYVMKASLSVLHNIARNCDVKHFFKESKTSEFLKPFIEFKDEMLKALAMLTLAYIVEEEENAELIDGTGTIHSVADWLNKSLDNAKRRYKGFTPYELTQGLDKLAVNDSNKTKIVDENVLPMFLRMLHHDDVREQSAAARALWTMAFEPGVRSAVVDNKELMEVLQNLRETATDEKVLKHVFGALWILKEEADSAKRPHALTAPKTHVFISYSWNDKATVLKLKDRLKMEGYNVWIDIEQMKDNTLEAMAQAVENAAIVLVCMSEKYKQSPNCRTEAEYMYQLRKDFIPLMLQRKYRPDGWLGIVLGAKLYIDCSGRYPLEKSMQLLLKELRGRGQMNGPLPHRQETTDHTLTECHNLAASLTDGHTAVISNGVHKESTLTREDIALWLSQNRLAHLNTAFAPVDGPILAQMKHMRKEAAEFFYQSLERHFHMTFLDILVFCNALDRLAL